MTNHFKGKTVAGHLREARQKGAIAASEVHGIEMPGHISAAADSCKETAVIFLLLTLLGVNISLLLLFSAGFLIWKMGRSASLGWARLERLHRLIEEERWEIEHHRQQERQELTELYAAKGFSGKLLEEVIDVLMADDSRLLRVMLEEELGVTLEVYEHPLKQALGAGIGVLLAAGLCLLASLFNLVPIASALLLILASFVAAKCEKNRILPAIIWSLAIAFLASIIPFLLHG